MAQVFFNNLPTILLHAIVGTLLNTFLTGWVMWHVGELTLGSDANFRLVDAFLFGSFISAVDPVAVLAVFEKEHVDATIHGVVAGTATLALCWPISKPPFPAWHWHRATRAVQSALPRVLARLGC